ncbi:MAG TPA: fatty acid--CoA ligase [Casimicrobiaceae bacterium]|jgi:fatty-acyl-CoA synthase
MTATAVFRGREAHDYPLLIKQLWHSALRRTPEQEIVYRDLKRFTYRQLRERVGRLANVLAGLGVKPGDTVAVMDWDSHRYLESYYAVPMMGAVLMTVNVRLSPQELIYTITQSGASVLLLNADFKALLETIGGELTTIKRCIWLDDKESAPPAGASYAGEYERLLAAASPGYSFPDLDENTRATTFYTTGTTGLPKGVYFSHRQLVLHTLAVMAAAALGDGVHGFNAKSVYMPMTPMFHVHAWGCPYAALLLGIKQVYPGRYVPETLLELIKREGVTYTHCVPAILQMLLSHPQSQAVDFAGFSITIGGSALSTGLAAAARARGMNIVGGYGMSETCPFLTTAVAHPILGKLEGDADLNIRCKAGAPAPLVELRVVDANMRDVPEGAAGEIIVRAPWLTMGYSNNETASHELWAGGYLHTQDIGYFERGYLKVTDRIKDVIKTGGEWVSSLQIEDLISTHPAVAECAVIGVSDEKWGERPLALVVAKTDANLEPDDIRKHVKLSADNGVIPQYAVPERILIVGSIARTSVGKIDKKKLREQYAR